MHRVLVAAVGAHRVNVAAAAAKARVGELGPVSWLRCGTPTLRDDEARWRAVVDVNLTGPFLVSQLVARQMAAAGGGVILHIASIDAFGGDGPYAAYNASKAGLLGLNRTMALELGRHNMAALTFMARTSTPWALLPAKELGCGSASTCWRWLDEWSKAGVFDQLQAVLLDAAGRVDLEHVDVDSFSLRAVKGGA